MGIRTRSTTNSPAKAIAGEPQGVTSIDRLQEPPPKVLIVPRSISAESRLIQLSHPRDGGLTQFLFSPEHGLFEFTKVKAEPIDPRSILFCLPDMDLYNKNTPAEPNLRISNGFVSQNAEVLTTTPFDLTFILLVKMAPESVPGKKSMFQPADDLLDIPEAEDKHLRYILLRARAMVETAMSNICDTVDAGDEKLYRYSEDKVLHLCLDRANRVVDQGLPTSLEERFVTRALEVPVLNMKREESEEKTCASIDASHASIVENSDSQSTSASTTASAVFSESSDASSTSAISESATPIDVRRLLQIRVALNFILTTCLPRHVGNRIQEKLSSDNSPISFKALDDELLRISALKAEALASRSLTDFSRKRTMEDEEVAELRAEKKRKHEEDEKKRKANESRGVRDLKKVNVSGMKKMSDFFGKKPAIGKAKT